MLDTMAPTISVYIYFYMLYTFLLLAKSYWFTSNIEKLLWYDNSDDDNSNDDDNGDDDDDGDTMVMMLVMMMLKMIIMALTDLKY